MFDERVSDFTTLFLDQVSDMRAGGGPCREVDSAAHRLEDEWFLSLTPANLYRYDFLGKILPSLKVQLLSIVPIPFACFLFLLSPHS